MELKTDKKNMFREEGMLSLTLPMSMVATVIVVIFSVFKLVSYMDSDYSDENIEEVNKPSTLRGRGSGCGRKMQCGSG